MKGGKEILTNSLDLYFRGKVVRAIHCVCFISPSCMSRLFDLPFLVREALLRFNLCGWGGFRM